MNDRQVISARAAFLLLLFILANWGLWVCFGKNNHSLADFDRMQRQQYRDVVTEVRNTKGLISIRAKHSGQRIFFHRGEYQLFPAKGQIEDLVFAGDSIVRNAWSDTIYFYPAKGRRANFECLVLINDFEKMKRKWLE